MIGSFSLLQFIIVTPLLGALACLCGLPARRTATVSAVVTLGFAVASAIIYACGPKDGFQLVNRVPLIPSHDVHYVVGVDGLGIVMVLLSAVVLLCAVCSSHSPKKGPGGFYACLLFIATGAIGAFSSLDMIVMYAFHELALIPTFLLIGIWGTGNNSLAAWRATIYLGAGSFVLLLGLIGLYLNLPPDSRTFDLSELLATQNPQMLIPAEHQGWLFLLLLVGFGSLVSLFPLHSWAPQAYACAPAPVAMLHAGVLKKFGLFGLIRIALPLLPEGLQQHTNLLLSLVAGNIAFIGLVTVSQKTLDLTLGYSSVMHMGYIFLGLAAGSALGLGGAMLLMVAHGLSIAFLFSLSGQIRKRTGTLRYSDLGGMGSVLPRLMFAFGIATFASIGLPGLANFPGELLVLFAAFGAGDDFSDPFRVLTIIAAFGVVLSAVYMLRAFRALFMGPQPALPKSTSDLQGAARFGAALLAGLLIVLGLWPRLILDLVQPTVETALALR